jgi:hypothetical protein
VSQSFSLFSVTPAASLFSVIPSILSHSVYSQSFLPFSVIPSFSVTSPARPHLAAPVFFPLPSYFPGAQRPREIAGDPLSPGPHASVAPPPYKEQPLRPSTQNPNPSRPSAAARCPAARRPAPPRIRCSAVPQPRPRPAASPPRRQEASRSFCPRPPPTGTPEFSSSAVSGKFVAVAIARRRCHPGPADPSTGFAGAPRVDPWGPGAWSTPASSPSARARALPPPAVVVFLPPQPLGELRPLSLVLLH